MLLLSSANFFENKLFQKKIQIVSNSFEPDFDLGLN